MSHDKKLKYISFMNLVGYNSNLTKDLFSFPYLSYMRENIVVKEMFFQVT